MKKIEIKGKLTLNKATIANLNNEQMTNLKGGRAIEDNPHAILWTLIKCRQESMRSVCGCEHPV